MDGIRGAGGILNTTVKESGKMTETPAAPPISLNESAWGEDSSNRNQYFGSDAGQNEPGEGRHEEKEDQVVSLEVPSNDVIPPPKLLLKKRPINPIEAILRTMARNAKKLIPFSSGWEREYLNPNRILENGKKKHDYSTQT